MEPRPYYTSPVFTPARHRTRQMFHMAQPMDSSTPVLDLSIRKHQPPTPSPEAIFYSHNNNFNNKIFGNPQQHQLESPSSSTFFGDSESDASRSSDGGSPFNQYSLKMKATRPFKAYPKDPLQFFVGGAKPEAILGRNSMEAYAEFRNNMLSTIQESHKTTNKNMRRVSSSSRAQNAINDPTYWEKRRKNNEAAKRSRDLRRKKEDEIAIRCVFLENENVQLKTQVLTLKDDVERLSKMLGPIRN